MNDHAISLALSLRFDPHPSPDYQVCRSQSDISNYIKQYSPQPLYLDQWLLAEDTESLPGGNAYCVTFSVAPGTGRLIYINDQSTLREYRALLNTGRPHQLFHNYLHDVVPFTNFHLPIHTFTDTMVTAYNMCLGGGGDDADSESKAGRGSLSLKSLAYRHCNMRMTSFKDTVYPHSIPKLATWLDTSSQSLTPPPKRVICNCGHARSDHESRGATGKTKGRCPLCDCARYKESKELSKTSDQQQVLNRLYLKSSKLRDRLLTETATDWAETKNDPWKKIRDNWEQHDMDVLNNLAGPIPVPSIAFVPEPQLLFYACRDADATLRLYYYLQSVNPWLFWP